MNQLAHLNTIPSMWRGHAPFALWLVRRVLPLVIVDLGVDFGFSTCCFATPGFGFVYGVDSFEGDSQTGFRDNERFVREKVSELQLNNVCVIKGYFDDVARDWRLPIDLLHVDGFHSYEAVKNDYETWRQFLQPNGVILFHDTCVEGYGVPRLFEEIDLPKVNFGHTFGLGVVTRNEALLQEIREKFGEQLVA